MHNFLLSIDKTSNHCLPGAEFKIVAESISQTGLSMQKYCEKQNKEADKRFAVQSSAYMKLINTNILCHVLHSNKCNINLKALICDSQIQKVELTCKRRRTGFCHRSR